MAKYVLIYNGGSMPESDEEKERVMAQWGAWYEELGDAVVDPGHPLGPASSIGDDGTTHVTGYSILEADSMDAAVEHAKGNPMAGESGTRIDVHEAFSM